MKFPVGSLIRSVFSSRPFTAYQVLGASKGRYILKRVGSTSIGRLYMTEEFVDRVYILYEDPFLTFCKGVIENGSATESNSTGTRE